MAGKPWYNNGEIEIQVGNGEIVPDGFVRGRLPWSQESREKASKSHMGHAGYWTGKKMPPDSRGDTLKKMFANGRKQWNTGLTKDTDDRIRAMALKKVGSIPHNTGIPMSDAQKQKIKDSQYATKKKNNSFHVSYQEDNYYRELCMHYGDDNVIRQYIDKRYPFACDFYIPSEDLFIEFNRTWTHGGHPFDPMSLEDISKLEMWEEKAKTSKYYKNAIYTWTNLDVRKQEVAKDNKLNYKVIY